MAAVTSAAGLSRWMLGLMASACGMSIANIYYAQPLIGTIAPDIGLSPALSSFIVTLAQVGYCTGLILLVPLGDRFESRRVIVGTLALACLALALAAQAGSVPGFLTASLLIGTGSVAVQMIIPMATHLSSPALRGSVVGSITSGLLAGIMLARPVAGLIASTFGWRAVFIAAAVGMLVLAIVLMRLLPVHRVSATNSYFTLIGSLWPLLRDTPVLRRRAAYQAALFAAYSLFWTSMPLVLSSAPFGMSQGEIALFAIAAITGTIAAPLAGRMADAGKAQLATGIALCAAAIACLFAWLARDGSIPLMIASAVLLDIGVWSCLVLGQRAISLLDPAVRSRLNALYTAIFFAGGAAGSACASVALSAGGWQLSCLIAIAFPLSAMLLFTREACIAGVRVVPTPDPLLTKGK